MARSEAIMTWLKMGIATAFSAIMLYYSIQFLMFAVGVVRVNVLTGIVAIAAGFALLSGSITLLRDVVIVFKAEKSEVQGGS